MTAENLKGPTPIKDQSMGEALVALQKRNRLIQGLKVTAVWIGLIAIVTGGMLMLHISPSYMLQHYDVILQGAGTTIYVSLVSIAIATILALLGSIARLSTNSIAQGVSGFYVSLIRGTPLLIQIYVIYLGLPQIGQQ
ncbi:MAG TPA: ABC transporter permease subunit, partial [Anaerolineales bacterium]